MVEVLYLDLDRPATIPFAIVEKLLMVMGKVDICIIPYPLLPIIHVVLVDLLVYMFMFMIDVYIGLRSATFLPITMVDYTFSTQGSLEILFLGV